MSNEDIKKNKGQEQPEPEADAESEAVSVEELTDELDEVAGGDCSGCSCCSQCKPGG